MSAMARWQEQESGAKFQYSNTSSKNGDEMSEERLYLYLKRQSEGTWMDAKCCKPSKGENLKEGGAPSLGFGLDEMRWNVRWSVGTK
jgi:hypothetical protein